MMNDENRTIEFPTEELEQMGYKAVRTKSSTLMRGAPETQSASIHMFSVDTSLPPPDPIPLSSLTNDVATTTGGRKSKHRPHPNSSSRSSSSNGKRRQEKETETGKRKEIPLSSARPLLIEGTFTLDDDSKGGKKKRKGGNNNKKNMGGKKSSSKSKHKTLKRRQKK